MSTPKPESPLEAALAGVPAQFRRRLIAAYENLKREHAEARYEAAGLAAGKFCEIGLRLLQHVVTGSSTAFGTKIPNFADECRKLVASPASSIVESLRTIIPRALVFMYTMRSKRGIGHVGGDIEANRIDSATLARLADWVVCELVRAYHGLSLEEAQDLIDTLATRSLPDIWEVAGKKRVLRDACRPHSKPSYSCTRILRPTYLRRTCAIGSSTRNPRCSSGTFSGRFTRSG